MCGHSGHILKPSNWTSNLSSYNFGIAKTNRLFSSLDVHDNASPVSALEYNLRGHFVCGRRYLWSDG